MAHKAKKSLGQNFLNDSVVLEKIVQAAELSPGEQVLEVGPGKGALTENLLAYGAKVTAVEYDADLIPLLHDAFGQDPNFELIHEDALQYTPPSEPYKLVANLPYYITSPLINHFLREAFENDWQLPTCMVIMVQKEVAEKILAERGKHSVLSLQVHLFADVEWILEVPRTAFDPAPKVDSAVIRITPHKEQSFQKADLKQLFWLIHAGFSSKRKKLANNLGAALRQKPADIKTQLSELGIDPETRAEDLTIEEWKKMTIEL